MRLLVMVMLLLFSATSAMAEKYEKIVDNSEELVANNDLSTVITRYNSIGIVLDNLYFKTASADNTYYVQVIVKYYQWDNNVKDDKKLIYQCGELFKEVIRTNNNIAKLSNIRLSPPLPLKNVNLIGLQVKVVKVDPNEKKLNAIVDGFINKLIADYTGLELLNSLIQKQSENSEALVFNSDYDIPLNSVEYNIINSKSPQRLLRTDQNVGVEIDATLNSKVLSGSLLGEALSAFSKIFSTATGSPDLTSIKIQSEGLITLSFSSTSNPLLPPNIQDNLKRINAYIFSTKYKEAEESIERTHQVTSEYEIADDSNQQMTFSVNQFCRLSLIYMNIMRAEDLSDPKNPEVKKWLKQYRDFKSQINAHAKANKYQVYGVKNVLENDKDKVVSVYVPYSLDECSIREFVRYQILIEQILGTFTASKGLFG